MGHPWSPSGPHFPRPMRSNADTDPLAARINDHIGLVRRLAWQLHRRAPGVIELEELVQTGMVALVEAASHWQDRGHAFATYAQVRIRGAMVDRMRRDATLSRGSISRKREVEQLRIRLMGELLRMPTDAEMAAALGLDAHGWHALQREIEPVALEPIEWLGDEDGPSLTDPGEGADVALIRAEGAEMLARAVAALPERQALVLQLYFVEELPLEDIGRILGVGAARVCQIKKQALDLLRQAMLDGGAEG